ncbi:metalloproteinase inhibitor 4-like protein [Dinothrombium tinctorium]|uniref:Metalloproteinase inhibitor 4-like protein n=1 Tax=Dinothrombium tinctorium TaxID=1965070 RepID=A0A3S3NWC4_9ACAR|nr:metalloproteinase inhibitor 4-like protein [Dinothrombium tinctorium]RWS00010.1 metalloproteinase inhibitor 4-like protein [Dinothrombium tinctorium]
MSKVIIALLAVHFSTIVVLSCLCAPSTPLQKICVADAAIKARVTGRQQVSQSIHYTINVIEVLKSNQDLSNLTTLVTSTQPGHCGLELDNNALYFLTGNIHSPRARPQDIVLTSSTCRFVLNLDKASDNEKRAVFDLFKPSLNCNQTDA